jgi:hypothetical protein
MTFSVFALTAFLPGRLRLHVPVEPSEIVAPPADLAPDALFVRESD